VDEMGIAIAREQGGLIKNHCRIPDRRGTAEERQDEGRKHRLHEEEQAGADEKSDGK
jgi:hypothetical protein